LQVNDVNSVTLPVDVLLHLRVPAARLVAEVNSSLQEFFHRNIRQLSSFVPPASSLAPTVILSEAKDLRSSFRILDITRSTAGVRRCAQNDKPGRPGGQWTFEIPQLGGHMGRPYDYRFENWNRLRAPFCPYFFLSLARGSRVRKPP